MNANNNINNIGYGISNEKIIFQNRILRNTYLLLSFSLSLCFITSFFTVFFNLQMPILLLFFMYFGLSFLIEKYNDSYIGLCLTVIFTLVMGMFIGQIVINYMHMFTNALDIIFISGILTTTIFLSLSGYALFTKKNFSFLKGFLVIMSVVILFSIIVSFFVNDLFFHFMISGAIILFSSAGILYKTSSMVLNGDQQSYISISLSLFLDIINIFLSLIRILSIFMGRRD